ncbi:MAG: glycosyltransferase family 9 protein [Acidobacteriota bacterium]|nr:glycosyltransferase family 9 protein [Acidobacteriota bacterium]
MLAGTLLAIEKLLRPKASAVDPGKVRHVLVLEYLVPLGCCVHLTPFFEALKRCRPELEITVATRAIGSQVLRHSPRVDHLLDTPDPLTDLRGTIKSLRMRLRSLAVEPDCVLTGASDQRTRIALLGAFSTPGWRGGYTVNPAVYQRPLAYDLSLSLIGNNLRLAQLLGCQTTSIEPQVFFSHADAETARTLLREVNPDARPVLVMVTQNSGGQRTGWHTDRFARVIAHASHTLGYEVVYVGTSADAPAIEAICRASGGVGRSLAGKTSVTQLAALLAMSDAMVTLDTGTMHVGRAAGTPMVVLGPSWQKPLEWLPLTVPSARILRGPDRDAIPEGYQLDEISAEAVIEAFEDIGRTYPPDEQARARRVGRSLSPVDHLPAS